MPDAIAAPTADPLTDQVTWIVLVNGRGEYSLWPAPVPAPDGWIETGPEGDRETCAAWLDTQWQALSSRSGAA